MQLKLSMLSILSTGTDGSGDLGKVQTPGTSGELTVALNEGGTRTYRVPNGTNNQTVDLAGLAAVSYIVVKTDKAITLRTNATNSIAVAPPASFGFGYLLLSTSGVTALDISNASGDTATVVIQLAGDP